MKIHHIVGEFHGGPKSSLTHAPTLTPSMRIALHDLKLDRIVVAYPGVRRYPLAERVEAVPLAELVGSGEDGRRIFRKGER